MLKSDALYATWRELGVKFHLPPSVFDKGTYKFITSALLQETPLTIGGKRNRKALRSPTPCKESG